MRKVRHSEVVAGAHFQKQLPRVELVELGVEHGSWKLRVFVVLSFAKSSSRTFALTSSCGTVELLERLSEMLLFAVSEEARRVLGFLMFRC